MPKVDFANVSDTSDFTPVPNGEHPSVLDDVETDFTRGGDEMWKLRWAIEGGEHQGRLLFDNMVFNDRAMPRVKLICNVLGLDVSGEVDLEPEMLIGRRAMIETYIEEYTDSNGAQKARNAIPWDGYRAVPQVGDKAPF